MKSSSPTEPIDVQSLRELLENGEPPRVIDVRSPQEFKAVHIPGSYNVPLVAFEEHRDEVQRHVGAHDVLVCRSGQRAMKAQQTLAESGAAAQVLEGGILAWQHSGAPVNQGRSVWGLERQVRFTVGSLVLLSLVVSILIPEFKWLAAFVGAGLTFAAITQTCMLEMILRRLPFNHAAPYDAKAVVSQLARKS